MASIKVKVLYDFSAEPGTAELSVNSGEILTVTRQDVGEGWWEGTNQNGQTGFFPASYVENYQETDFWDDEWDDDSEGTTFKPLPPEPITSSLEDAPTPLDSYMDNARAGENKTVIARNFNRYSTFVKTGGEGFILGNLPSPLIAESERIRIALNESGVLWDRLGEPYVCMVASPKKESKLKGFKSFIAYQITPSFNNIQVSRRYKHFDWLHIRLEEKYSLIPIPPLPDKQISGRYEDNFIERRKNQLQAFVDCVCRHPVLSRSPVWEHFITCTDDKLWKTGKRKAERDELVGGKYFYAIETPDQSLSTIMIDQEVTSCGDFVQKMDGAVKRLMDLSSEQTKKYQGQFKRDFIKVGQSIAEIGKAMSTYQPKSPGHENLTAAIKVTGTAFMDIGVMYEDQTKLDWEPLGDMLHIYKGFLASMPDIFSIHKKALQTKKECEKLAYDKKMGQSQLVGVSKRTDVVSYALLAELNHFQNERAEEVSKSLKGFLAQQIAFYQKITAKLQQALESYDL